MPLPPHTETHNLIHGNTHFAYSHTHTLCLTHILSHTCSHVLADPLPRAQKHRSHSTPTLQSSSHRCTLHVRESEESRPRDMPARGQCTPEPHTAAHITYTPTPTQAGGPCQCPHLTPAMPPSSVAKLPSLLPGEAQVGWGDQTANKGEWRFWPHPHVPRWDSCGFPPAPFLSPLLAWPTFVMGKGAWRSPRRTFFKESSWPLLCPAAFRVSGVAAPGGPDLVRIETRGGLSVVWKDERCSNWGELGPQQGSIF